MTPKEEAAIRRELEAISESLRQTLALSRLLLAMRIEQDGHAKNLGEARRIAEDLDQVAKLYPEPAD